MNATPKILLGAALLSALLAGCKREETTVVPPATETPATTSGTSGTTGATGTGTDTAPAGAVSTGPGTVPTPTDTGPGMTTPPTGGTGTGTAVTTEDPRDKDKRTEPTR